MLNGPSLQGLSPLIGTQLQWTLGCSRACMQVGGLQNSTSAISRIAVTTSWLLHNLWPRIHTGLGQSEVTWIHNFHLFLYASWL